MRVLLAEHAGTCFGVERALALVDEVLAKPGSVSSLGPIIHNPGVVADFAKRGLSVVDSPDDVRTDTVVIRSHGVAPEEARALSALDVAIADATCPYVTRAQRAASRLAALHGCVLVVGEAGHPEVEALCAYVAEAGGCAIVASSPDDLPEDLPSAIGVVVQTTQRVSVLDGVLAALSARDIVADTVNTICNATTERQDAALALARQVDAMVVVGGKHSSNTTRLAEICATACPRVLHIESADELSPDHFAACETVGLTAGASTPESQIRAVLEALSRF